MPHLQNTTHVTYRLLSREPVRLELRPLVAFRLHEAPVNHPVAAPYALQAFGDRFEIVPGADMPSLRLFLYGDEKAFTVMPETYRHVRVRARTEPRLRVLWRPLDARLLPADADAGHRRERWSPRPSRGKRSAR